MVKFLHIYKTALPKNECQRHLHNTIGFTKSFSGEGIKGLTMGDWFILWYQRKASVFYVENSFQTFCIGRLRPNQDGTMIHYYLGIHPLTILFFIIIVTSFIGFWIYDFASGGFNFSSFVGLGVSFVFVVSLVLLGFLGLFLSPADDVEITEFIETAFSAD